MYIVIILRPAPVKESENIWIEISYSWIWVDDCNPLDILDEKATKHMYVCYYNLHASLTTYAWFYATLLNSIRKKTGKWWYLFRHAYDLKAVKLFKTCV